MSTGTRGKARAFLTTTDDHRTIVIHKPSFIRNVDFNSAIDQEFLEVMIKYANKSM